MIITVILIIILFLYFLWKSIKEKKVQLEKWKEAGNITEDTLIKGTVLRYNSSSQIFFQSKKIYVLEIYLKDEKYTYHAIYQKPLTDSFEKPRIEIGNELIAFGQWWNQTFYINRFDSKS